MIYMGLVMSCHRKLRHDYRVNLDFVTRTLCFDNECMICLQAMDANEHEKVTLLPCTHSQYCKGCVMRNIQYSRKCPKCRQTIKSIINNSGVELYEYSDWQELNDLKDIILRDYNSITEHERRILKLVNNVLNAAPNKGMLKEITKVVDYLTMITSSNAAGFARLSNMRDILVQRYYVNASQEMERLKSITDSSSGSSAMQARQNECQLLKDAFLFTPISYSRYSQLRLQIQTRYMSLYLKTMHEMEGLVGEYSSSEENRVRGFELAEEMHNNIFKNSLHQGFGQAARDYGTPDDIENVQKYIHELRQSQLFFRQHMEVQYSM